MCETTCDDSCPAARASHCRIAKRKSIAFVGSLSSIEPTAKVYANPRRSRILQRRLQTDGKRTEVDATASEATPDQPRPRTACFAIL